MHKILSLVECCRVRSQGYLHMISRIEAIQFDRPMGVGRTGPALMTCESAVESTVELVAKFTQGCDRREVGLAMEAISACLAADLGLPVPEPFLVEISPDFVSTIPDANYKAKIQQSNHVAFGSKHVTGGFVAWSVANNISDVLSPIALGIFVFDAMIDNCDRRDGNPNCLVRGDEVRIFDHELCFPEHILGWQAPWQLGALNHLRTPGMHIFQRPLRNRDHNFDAIRAAWEGLSDARLAEYETALPGEWADALPKVTDALQHVRAVRDSIDACLDEVRRVLA